MWDVIFSGANVFAMVAWAALILLPRWPRMLAVLLSGGVGLLCLVYIAGLVSIMGGLVDAAPVEGAGGGGLDFGSIEGVRSLFMSDGGVVVGWVHYLAFDLFVGLWIARDADKRRFNRVLQAPMLFATFMAGPLGLGVWLVVRKFFAREPGKLG